MQAYLPIVTAVLGVLGGLAVALVGIWGTRTAARQQEIKKLSDAVVTSEEDIERRRLELYDAGVWKLVETLRSQNDDLLKRLSIAEAEIRSLHAENQNLQRQNEQQQAEIDRQRMTISDLQSDIRNLKRRTE